MDAVLAHFPRVECLGDDDWSAVQDDLADWAAKSCGINSYLASFGNRPLPGTLQMLLTGIVIMADWIASNSTYFPLLPHADLSSPTQRALNGWATLGLPPAWRPLKQPPNTETLFRQRFVQMPQDAVLRPSQTIMVAAAQDLNSPGMIILEAPMGSGKTEAALLSAEIIASRFGQGGVAFLLPTMATSNALFQRAHDWLGTVPDERGQNQRQSMNLVHGKAALNPEFSRIRWRTSSMGDNDSDSDDSIIAPAWICGSKRSLLASFVVGTVDQLLMAGLKARHVVLRHLGLAGKVVIIDEVHAYDSYMSTYLDRVLSWLGAYGVPVIILSATLPPSRRQDLLRAYLSSMTRHPVLPETPRLPGRDAPAYPLVSICDSTGVRYLTNADDTRELNIVVSECDDDRMALLARLEEETRNGGCVGVICNTVSRAQEMYETLHKHFGDDVLLLHSRFIARDRLAKDEDLLQRLGKGASTRPQRLIVVGTQVLEQSLDIDFDLLITDIAPIDLLLQRIGRLHRHAAWDATRPGTMRQPRCLITGVKDWSAVLPEIDPRCSVIYEKALLLRTIAALRALPPCSGGSQVNLPSDITSLVEGVYDWVDGRITVPEEWGPTLSQCTDNLVGHISEKQTRAHDFLLAKVPRNGQSVTGLLKARIHSPDDDNRRGQMAVRDSSDSIEVVVVQRTADGTVRLLPWVRESNTCLDETREMSEPSRRMASMEDRIDTGELSTEFSPDSYTARVAATCTVTLPPAFNWAIDQVIDILEKQTGFAGWQQSSWLRGQLPLVLDENLNATLTLPAPSSTALPRSYRLHYDRTVGLQLFKDNDHD